MNRLPLENLRIIDLGQVYAGPYASRILADMGAEVIRVESAGRSGRGGLNPQPGAVYPDSDPGERPYNRSAHYNELNRNKLAVSLDLSKEQGREIFKRLVEISDVVVENFSSRVMANFGLDYPVLSRINPGLIMVSISGYGKTGPYRDYVSFGRGIEAMSGLSDITGYPDSGPLGPGIAYADANAGLHAAFAVLVALRQHRYTGRGQHIDLSLRESLTALMGGQVIDFSMNQRLAARRGNRDFPDVFQGCYRCLGDDAWIAVAVCSKDEWESLLNVVGNSSPVASMKALLKKGQDSSCQRPAFERHREGGKILRSPYQKRVQGSIPAGVFKPALSSPKGVSPNTHEKPPEELGDTGGLAEIQRQPPHPSSQTGESKEFEEMQGVESQKIFDALVESWTIRHDPQEAMDILQRAGIRAGVVNSAKELLTDPHLHARGFFQKVTHPESGTHLNSGVPWKFNGTPFKIRMPAPCFAEHNDYVFGELLGMSSEAIAKLEEEGVIAKAPIR